MKISQRVILILSLILLLQFVLRVPFLQEPLETDEGAYAYIAQRMLAGEVPYRDYFDHKPPAVYFIYAGIFALFGDSFTALRVFTAFFSLLITLSVFAIGYLFWGESGGLLSALLYAIFSGGAYVQGTSANTETFMILPMILAFYSFLVSERAEEKNKWKWLFAAGALSGLAVMAKQVALFNFLALFGFNLFFALKEKKEGAVYKAGIYLRNRFWWLLLGFALFPLLFVIYFWARGAFSDLINGVVFYNLAYSKTQVWWWGGLARVVFQENLLLWVLSAVAIVFLSLRGRNLLLVGWALASLAGVIAGKSFFGHYFIQVIPALVLLSTAALLFLFNNKKVILTVLIILVCAGLNIGHWVDFLLSTPEEISVKKYNTANFAIARDVASYVQSAAAPQESIYVWGAEPEVYFYSQRKAASKYIYYLPILFGSREYSLSAQDRVMADIGKDHPQYIVLANPEIRWPYLINLLALNYARVGEVAHWQIWERMEKWQK
jgi:4-amino-4-deoxy-L-arabinose transferase-like glycosyltransferase